MTDPFGNAFGGNAFAAPRFPSSNVWRQARVAEVSHPTARAVVLRLEVPDRVDHLPGQHYVVRLTAPDGYTATRSYSLASPPSDPLSELYVEELPDGEVSGYLAEVVQPDDTLEVRGPIGGFFVWDGSSPALCVGGGSGVAPFISMIRHAAAVGTSDQLTVVAAARTLPDLPYPAELAAAGAVVALSREAHGARPAGRVTAAELAAAYTGQETVFVCGSAVFAESASRTLVDIGVPAEHIRVERFGPSGT